MQTPPPFRSGHLDIRGAQSANKNDGLKISHHIILRLGTTGVKKQRFGRSKLQHSSEVAKFAGYIGIDLTFIFCINDFFVQFLVFEALSILYLTARWDFPENLEEIFANLIQTLTSSG